MFDQLTEPEAFQCEVDTILEMKYFCYELCNFTNGGAGLSGFKWTPEQMQHHPSLLNIGRVHSQESKDKRLKYLLGRPVSTETRIKLSNSHKTCDVFKFIVKSLLGKRIISLKKRGEILGVAPETLYSRPKYYMGFTPEAIKKSADQRRGKPAWNSGKKSPGTVGVLNNSADTSVQTFIRQSDGLLFTGTRYELSDSFSLNLAQVGKLFYTKPRIVAQGWSILKETNGTN